jgi:uncharacterized protein with ATP-grasp and redox domains
MKSAASTALQPHFYKGTANIQIPCQEHSYKRLWRNNLIGATIRIAKGLGQFEGILHSATMHDMYMRSS